MSTKKEPDDVEVLRQRLQARRGDFAKIEKSTKLPMRWLRAFSQGQIDGAPYRKLQQLAPALGMKISLGNVIKLQPVRGN